MEPVRTVVEIATRGKLVVGEPYFAPGVPIALDRKSLHGRRARRARRRRRAGAAARRSSACSGRPSRIEAVLEGLLVERGARQEFEPYEPPAPTTEGRTDLRDLTTFTIDPDTAKDFDDAISVAPRGRRRARVGAHRRRLVLRPGRLAARPRRRRAARSRPTSPASSRRCSRPSSRTTSARCGRTSTGSASRSSSRRRRRAELLPLGDPQRRAPDLRPGAAARRAARGRRRARARRRVLGRAAQAAASPAARCGSSRPELEFEFDGKGGVAARLARASPSRTRSSRS